MSDRAPIPRDSVNDYTPEMAERRAEFLREKTGTTLNHVRRASFDPAVLPGNIENFIGVAQVPIGLAGPLRINGEHAQGDFYVPLATTEGTLVASYSRGMRVLSECGGVTATVVKRSMQRAPVFMFGTAREARDFGEWLTQRFDDVKQAAEATTRSGRLVEIEQYAIGNLLYLRFNYTTGDAAGQNMTGKATHAACEWIHATHPARPKYMLSGSIDTDKKHSAINTLRTRGRRVVAEAVIRNDVLQRLMRVDTRTLFKARQVSNAGALLAGTAYNGPHAANGITAMFIATGQDVANVAESHAGITYAQLLDNGDYYWSVTLTSLIVATYGGGTGLPTQRECLELLDCYGNGKADKLAEIVAAVVLAGDISLGSAVLAGDWVTSHEKLGRNRP
ncbi:MAG: hydroxymethylglutaryl-CoA reductase [Burkholderiaceae bacterium]|jgi:hydroxymethylglutaryl-CoA reductase (NADPH)|nr:hydroxymethylglutaryl-CoA reductase [Burkholderiaceae bacterium]